MFPLVLDAPKTSLLPAFLSSEPLPRGDLRAEADLGFGAFPVTLALRMLDDWMFKTSSSSSSSASLSWAVECWISTAIESSSDRSCGTAGCGWLLFGLLLMDRDCLRGIGLESQSSSESEAMIGRDLPCRAINLSCCAYDYLVGSWCIEPVMDAVSCADVFQISQHRLPSVGVEVKCERRPKGSVLACSHDLQWHTEAVC